MTLKGMHHVRLVAADLEGLIAFARDFGLIEVEAKDGRHFFRGVGPFQYSLIAEAGDSSELGCVAFEVESEADLVAAHQQHGASAPQAIDGPGGGQFVSLEAPGGIRVELVHGITPRERDPLPPLMEHNQGYDKIRRGVFQRKSPLGPPPLLRLGHIGLFVTNWQAMDAWFCDVLGLRASDQMYAGNQSNRVGGFYRIDRGSEYVDHHVVGLFQLGPKDALHHISFEVPDSETQFMAHRWLAQCARNSVWGVGRHPLGSHVFDVWKDPNGFRFETFSDTDLLNDSFECGLHEIGKMEMDVWSDRDVSAYFA